MMIKGLGNDIIEVSRIKGALERHGELFLRRTFTEKEIAYCSRYKHSERHYAGRFAAKEAIVKALGFGFGDKIGFLDIEITNEESGKPVAALLNGKESLLKDGALSLSISHCHEYATAIALIV